MLRIFIALMVEFSVQGPMTVDIPVPSGFLVWNGVFMITPNQEALSFMALIM